MLVMLMFRRQHGILPLRSSNNPQRQQFSAALVSVSPSLLDNSGRQSFLHRCNGRALRLHVRNEDGRKEMESEQHEGTDFAPAQVLRY